MAKTIPLFRLGAELDSILKEFDKLSIAKTKKGLRNAVITTWGAIIEDTPIGIGKTDGRTRGSWFVAQSLTKKLGRRNKRKGKNYVRNSIAKIDLLSQRIFLYNNSDQINVLEFGGYVKNPKLGTFNKKTRRYEIRSANGFSKQAPRGMVRLNLLKWRKNLKNSFKDS